jgi:alkanesulfonate monooxygenase SsuD/methylene tetrahydromethanopterin reductase-like flavin-dependent oxidoreductase (luciferase family)
MDEGVELLRRAWTEERVTFEGRFYSVRDLNVTPKPVQRPHPPLWLAARGEAPGRRAARFGAGLLHLGPPAVYESYAAALRADGVDPATMPVLAFRRCVVSDDPDRTWAAMRDQEQYASSLYATWYGEAADLPGDADRLRAPVDADAARRAYLIGPPDDIVARLAEVRRDVPFTHLLVPGTVSGLPPSDTAPRLERFAREVIPRFGGERDKPVS